MKSLKMKLVNKTLEKVRFTKRIISFCLVLTLSFGAMAQGFSIKGKIIDDNTNEALMYVNCVIFNQKDSLKQIKGTASDTNGVFVLKDVKKENYNLVLTFIGYEKMIIPINSSMFKGNVLDLKEVKMKIAGEGLGEIEIVAMKDRVKLDADKMTVNIDQTTAQSVTNAFELLKKTPGIAIDNEDNLKLNGKSGVLFQFQGRDMKLPWKSLVQILKATPATLIDKIEIMANPSSKYDAEGVAGIVNLIFKQDKNEGISLSVGTNAYYSNELSYMGDLNFSHVSKKFTNTLSFSTSNWKQRMEQTLSRELGFGNDSIFIKQTGKNLYNAQDYTINAGSEYQINKRNSIALNLTYSKSKSPLTENPNQTLYTTLFGGVRTDSLRYDNTQASSSDMNNYIVNLNYQRKLDTLGGKFSTDFDFIHNSQSSLSASNTRYFFQNISPNTAFKIEDLNNETSSSYNSYVFRVDYTKPLSKTLKMELGGKVSITKVDNNFKAMLNDTNDLTKTNHFIYNENINALYGSLNKSFGEKTSLRLGLRMENANLKGEQQIDSISFTQSYTNLFPNLSLSHQFSPKYQSTFTYSMRISRPTYDNLNPFLSKTDDYSYQTGNPDLRPQYTHNFSLQNTFLYMIFTSLTYSYTKDVVSQMPVALPNSPIVYYMPQNISSSHNLNLSVSTSIPLTKWWTSVLYLSGNYTNNKSPETDLNISQEAFSFVGYTAQSFTLPKKYKAEISGVYVSPGVWGVYRFDGFYGVNLNFNKNFFKEMLTVSLGVQNLFSARVQGGGMEMGNAKFELKHEAQHTMLSVGLRFNFGQNLNIDRSKQKDEFDQRASGKREQQGGMGF